MGGDSGGNDCVHVIDVGASQAVRFEWREEIDLLVTTDVIVHDENGNACQYTYQEFRDHVAKVKAGEYDHINEYVSPEGIVPIKIDLSGVDPSATGMDPSAQARLDALPDVSGTMTFEGGPDARRRFAEVMGNLPDAPHVADGTHADYLADPFAQPPGGPSLPRPFVNEPLAEIDAWDRRYGS